MANAALLLLFIPVPGLTRRYLPAPRVFVPIGLTILICALLLAFWARRHLGRNWSGRITIKVDHELVKSGPYRWMRHPIYTANSSLCMPCTALVSGEWHALLGFALAAVAYWRKIGLEEANLAVAFGPAQHDYRRFTGFSCRGCSKPPCHHGLYRANRSSMRWCSEQPQTDPLELRGLQRRDPLADGGRNSAKSLPNLAEKDLHLAFDTALPEALSDGRANHSDCP